jgi:hypothetical protein
MILILAACGGIPEEVFPDQSPAEEVKPTDTPPPTATNRPSPTNTPLPPTIPPTPEPTSTPIPTPSPASEPIPALVVEDALEDAYDCTSQQLVNDFEVDITAIEASQQENSLLIQVLMSTPLVSDYSFAVLLTLVSGESFNAYLWETHDTVNRIGEIDFQTGQLLNESGSGNLLIEHDRSEGKVGFTIPISSSAVFSTTLPLTNTIVISGTGTPLQQFHIASFHTSQAGGPKNCDVAGPYEYRLEFPQ